MFDVDTEVPLASAAPVPDGVGILDAWLAVRATDARDPLSLEAAGPYRAVWGKWLRFLMPHTDAQGQRVALTPWHEATPTQVMAFLHGPIDSTKPGRAVSEVTRRRYWRLLERIYGYALVRGWVQSNPATSMELTEQPPSEDHHGAILSPSVWQAAQCCFPQGEGLIETRDRAILHLLFACALAPQEVINLTLQDVRRDARGRIIGLQLDGPGVHQRRKVALPPGAVMALQEWIALRGFHASWRALPQLFVTRKGVPMGNKALYELVQRVLYQASEQTRRPPPVRMGPQVVRNTALVRWLNEGVPPHEVVLQAGLKNLKGLYRLREHLNPNVRLAINERIGGDDE